MTLLLSHPRALVGAAPTIPDLPPLTPGQAAALRQIETGLAGANVVILTGAQASGRTLVMKHLHAKLGGKLLGVEAVFESMALRDPGQREEAVPDLLAAAHADHDLVVFDDLEMVVPDPQYSDRVGYGVQLVAACLGALSGEKKLVLSTNSNQARKYAAGFAVVSLEAFTPGEYRQILEHHAGRPLPEVCFEELFRAHRQLDGAGLALAGRMIRAEAWPAVGTDAVIALVDEFVVQSNVDMAEVARVSFDTLVGVDDLIDVLDRTILIPMTQPALAAELGLKPKRGILLYGPPGTGKTTVGRALAQRMKGKFFMIDGAFRPDEYGFHGAFDRILLNAQRSSPAVIFIDDADVIFRNGQTIGLARKLLSKLDGMESEAQAHVCVIMTAMDVSDMPPAMVRSGRVEVWLEMKLPEASKRKDMIRYFADDMLSELDGADWDRLAAATEGFTPADIRGLVGDARGHLAYDRRLRGAEQSFEHYLRLAAGEIAARKTLLEQV